MKPRSILIYLAVLIAVGLAYYIIDVRIAARDNELKEAQSKIFDLKMDQVTALKIKTGGEEIHITRMGENAWKIISPVQTPGDEWTVEGLIRQAVEGLKERVFEEPVEDISQFGLDNPSISLTLLNGDQPLAPTLSIGSANPMGQLHYARLGDSRDVFMIPAPLKTQLNQSLFGLRDKSLVLEPGEKIDGVELIGEKNIKLKKKGIRSWDLIEPETGPADDDVVQKLVYRGLKGDVVKFIEPKDGVDNYGLDQSSLRIRVHSGGDLKAEVVIGKKAEGSEIEGLNPGFEGYWVKSSERPEIMLVDAETIETLTVKAADLKDRRVLAMDARNLEKIEIDKGETHFLVKKINNIWDVLEPGEPISEDGDIERFIRGMGELKYERLASQTESESGFGLDKPDLKIVFSGKEETFSLAASLKPLDGDVLAVRSWVGDENGLDDGPVYLVSRDLILKDMPEEIRLTIDEPADTKAQSANGG